MLADGKNLQQTLAAVRSTPIGDGLPSPAVLLQGRNLRTNLHQMEHMLRPQHIDAEILRRKLEAKQPTAAYDHDAATSTFRRELHPGETVRMRKRIGVTTKSKPDHPRRPGTVQHLLETTLVTSVMNVRVPIPPSHRAVWSNRLAIRRVAKSNRKSRHCVVVSASVRSKYLQNFVSS